VTRPFAPTLLMALAVVLPLGGCAALLDPDDGDEPEEPEVRTVEGVTTDVAAIVGTFAAGPLHRPFLLESMAEFERFYGGAHPDHEASFHVRAFFQNGGGRIWVSRAEAATAAALTGGGTPGRGIAALDEANRFNLLLVPEILTSPGVADRPLAASAALVYAASRDAMLLLDPPAEVTDPQTLIDWVNGSAPGLRDRHAALFFGRIQVPAAASGGEPRWIGASGAAAGLFSWNDRERGVWSAPAGTNVPALSGVLDTDPLTTAQREALTQQQVIPLQRSPARLWGARTLLADSSPFTFLNVQRLTQYIEARVRAALEWTDGEPMEPELWDRARADAEAVMDELWRAGPSRGSSRRRPSGCAATAPPTPRPTSTGEGSGSTSTSRRSGLRSSWCGCSPSTSDPLGRRGTGRPPGQMPAMLKRRARIRRAGECRRSWTPRVRRRGTELRFARSMFCSARAATSRNRRPARTSKRDAALPAGTRPARISASERTASAAFSHPRFIPCPPIGLTRWAASPASTIGPLQNRSAR
jgi:uncharacterized protein